MGSQTLQTLDFSRILQFVEGVMLLLYIVKLNCFFAVKCLTIDELLFICYFLVFGKRLQLQEVQRSTGISSTVCLDRASIASAFLSVTPDNRRTKTLL